MITIVDYVFLNLTRFFLYIIGLFPERLQISLTTALVSFLLLFFPRSKYVTYRNLSICFPHYTKEQKKQTWRSVKKVLAKNILGFLYAPSLTREDAIKNLTIDECRDLTEEIKNNAGKGVLLLVPHFGSFELLAQYWCLHDKPFAILARGFGMKHLDAWWNRKRHAHGNVVFSRKGGFNDIVNYLNSGKNVAILFDQNVKRKHSIFVDFFGVPASTAKTVGLASLRTGCKVIFTTMVPTNPQDINDFKNYTLVAHSITPPHEREGSDTNKKIHDTIEEAHHHLEECIRKHPEYWFWIHRRFKTRPEGEPENLYDRHTFPEDMN